MAAALMALSSCATTQEQARRPIPPGHLLAGRVLSIHAPNSEGWDLLTSNADGVEFAKKGLQANESYGAQVLSFIPPTFEQPDAFVAFVKEGVARDTGPERFELLSSEVKQSLARPYPCASVDYVVRDKKAQTSRAKTETLLLQTIGLYCRHPAQQNLGFAIIYSHRGPSPVPNLGEQAQSFIDGVQVPEKAMSVSQATGTAIITGKFDRESAFKWTSITLWAVDNERVRTFSLFHPENIETMVPAGERTLTVRAAFSPGIAGPRRGAFIRIDESLAGDRRYRLNGRVQDDRFILWLEDLDSGEKIGPEVSSATVPGGW